MAGRRIPNDKRQKLVTLYNRGVNIRQASIEAGVSYAWARRYLKGYRNQPEYAAEVAAREYGEVEELGRPLYDHELCPEAAKAKDDFVYFRERYFGRLTPPWQAIAANVAVERLNDPDETYDVWNMPPGSGKTTFFVDLICWLIVRDRRVRIQWGSASAVNAGMNVARVRRSLERTNKMRASPREKMLGLAIDAEGVLALDFGVFKPLERLDVWRAHEFVVVQFPEDGAITEAQVTLQGVGEVTEYLGRRFDFVIWDDLVTSESISTPAQVEKQRGLWDSNAENRADIGGATFLVGQRMGPDDLYRYCLDKGLEIDDDDVLPMRYNHLVFKAHDETKCAGEHGRDAPSWPDGCLLDPPRIQWSKLRMKEPRAFAIQYQQQDTDPTGSLVKRVWIDGGIDKETGADHFGCWDTQRSIRQLPEGLKPPVLSIASVDPSGSKWWAIQWWLWNPALSQLCLMDIVNRKMQAPDLLDFHNSTGEFTGLMEEWQNASRAIGYPITAWVVETNAAQRYLIQYDHVQQWKQKHQTLIVPHATSMNKLDPELGVQATATWWSSGRIRLPGASPMDRAYVKPLTDQVCSWPLASRDDQVMASWFSIFHLPRLASFVAKPVLQARPSWVPKRRAS